MVRKHKARPTATERLVIQSHRREGREVVTVLNPATMSVTLLERWQRDVLELCDGVRPVSVIAAAVAPVELGDSSSVIVAVQKCLRLLYLEGLIAYEPGSPAEEDLEMIDELTRALSTPGDEDGLPRR